VNNLDKLIAYFEKFPGVGARQARRFTFQILTMPETDVAEMAELIASLKGTVAECHSCHRFFSKNGSLSDNCRLCDDPNRDDTKLMIVERDSDIQAIERSGVYTGRYFVLGGTIPLLNTKDETKLRGGALKQQLPLWLDAGLTEVILAFSVNPDGENTSRYVETLLTKEVPDHKLTISQLGRGLSTGSELEYADPETIKNALQNRH
jgi:recombination protein RecR